MMEKVLYNVSETGKLLGIGKGKVYELIRNGYLSALNLGGLKIAKTEIDNFINQYMGYDFKDMQNVTRRN